MTSVSPALNIFDLDAMRAVPMPNGRGETINGNLTDWVRHHDRYDTKAPSCHAD